MQDALYASEGGSVAFLEVAQRLMPGTVSRQFLDFQGLSAELVVFSFEAPASHLPYFDGRRFGAEWFLVRGFLEPKTEADFRALAYERPRAFAHAMAEEGAGQIIAPSAPAYHRFGVERWNWVYFLGGPSQLQGTDFPDDYRFEGSSLPEDLTSAFASV